MRLRLCVLFSGIGLAFSALGDPPRPRPSDAARLAKPTAEFEPPEMIFDGSEHRTRLFPRFADFDGDGRTDQLVGVGDRLLVYRNRGTAARLEYAKPTWFDEAEPSGRIPAG